MKKIKKIHAYKTSDNKLFELLRDANAHQKLIDKKEENMHKMKEDPMFHIHLNPQIY